MFVRSPPEAVQQQHSNSMRSEHTMASGIAGQASNTVTTARARGHRCSQSALLQSIQDLPLDGLELEAATPEQKCIAFYGMYTSYSLLRLRLRLKERTKERSICLAGLVTSKRCFVMCAQGRVYISTACTQAPACFCMQSGSINGLCL